MEEENRPVETGSSSPEANQSAEGMEDLLEAHGHEFRTLKRGDIIDGTVVRIDRDEILVDIGSKSEGVIPLGEMRDPHGNPTETLHVGDPILAYVLQPENQDGHVVLSLNRAQAERGWRVAQKRFEDAQVIEAEIIEFNKGGLIANVDGVRGFVPLSQIVDLRPASSGEEPIEERLKGMKGRMMFLKVIEINRRRNRLILSERVALQERRAVQKERLLTELKEGEVRHGRVSSLCDFGAFIDLGGADGLVHLSELSWGQVSHPSQVLKVGQEVETVVVGVDRESKKIALSLKRLQPEPWTGVADRYKVGQIVPARITKLASFGAFAQIEQGVEGLIHISELSDERIAHPKGVVKEGDEVEVRIIRIDAARHRLGLSLRQARGEGESEWDQASTDGAMTVDGEPPAEEEAAGMAHKVPSEKLNEEAAAEAGEEAPHPAQGSGDPEKGEVEAASA
ncbi:MAG TPA: 30S ribosomal protein S1 [Chloroflexota bacterium]